MAICPFSALWREALAVGLCEPDTVQWQRTDDFEDVASLAGLHADTVRFADERGFLKLNKLPSKGYAQATA